MSSVRTEGQSGKDSLICLKNKIPDPPKGFRLVTQEERDSIRGLSGYEYSYPMFLNCITRYDEEYKDWNSPGPYRYLWEDQTYATLIVQEKAGGELCGNSGNSGNKKFWRVGEKESNIR